MLHWLEVISISDVDCQSPASTQDFWDRLIEGNFNALLSRALEIGAKDMLEEPVVATTDEADEISF
jgi:hypothetical protein